MTKTEQAKQMMQSGDWKGCFKLVKTFRSGLSPKEFKEVGIAYECIVHPDFYSFRGQQWIDNHIENGKILVKKLLTV